jgi:hypothetical protein
MLLSSVFSSLLGMGKTKYTPEELALLGDDDMDMDNSGEVRGEAAGKNTVLLNNLW